MRLPSVCGTHRETRNIDTGSGGGRSHSVRAPKAPTNSLNCQSERLSATSIGLKRTAVA